MFPIWAMQNFPIKESEIDKELKLLFVGNIWEGFQIFFILVLIIEIKKIIIHTIVFKQFTSHGSRTTSYGSRTMYQRTHINGDFVHAFFTLSMNRSDG